MVRKAWEYPFSVNKPVLTFGFLPEGSYHVPVFFCSFPWIREKAGLVRRLRQEDFPFKAIQ